MSEIVRPTRDGIHGREYISTAIDIGRKMHRLEFDAAGNAQLNIPPLVETQLPILFNVLPFGNIGRGITLSMAKAAQQVQVMMYLAARDYDASLEPYRAHLIPLSAGDGSDRAARLRGVSPSAKSHTSRCSPAGISTPTGCQSVPPAMALITALLTSSCSLSPASPPARHSKLTRPGPTTVRERFDDPPISSPSVKNPSAALAPVFHELSPADTTG